MVDACFDSWDNIRKWCDENEDDKDELIDHFDNLVEGENNLGSILLGDAVDKATEFKGKM